MKMNVYAVINLSGLWSDALLFSSFRLVEILREDIFTLRDILLLELQTPLTMLDYKTVKLGNLSKKVQLGTWVAQLDFDIIWSHLSTKHLTTIHGAITLCEGD